jgi:hypothetical protein
MLRVFVIMTILFGLMALIKSPWFKGRFGELAARIAFRLFLDQRAYHVLYDVTLPTDNGTTQIDHVIVSRRGIFVIESKTWRGLVYGSECDRNWTQVVGRQRFQHQNPLRQNYGHARQLAELLALPDDKFKPIVIFVGDAKLKTGDKLPPNVLTYGCVLYIKSFKAEILSNEEVAEALAGIDKSRLPPGFRTNRQHIRNVRKIKARTEDGGAKTSPLPQQTPTTQTFLTVAPGPAVVATATTTQAPACPRCGKIMTLRTARKGQNVGKQFWGCPGFPTCRGIVKSQE